MPVCTILPLLLCPCLLAVYGSHAQHAVTGKQLLHLVDHNLNGEVSAGI